MNLPKAVIFDLDDTLVSYDDQCDPCWWTAIDAVSGELFTGSREEVFAGIKKVAGKFWSDPARHKAGRLDLDNTRIRLVTEAFRTFGFGPEQAAHRLAVHYSHLHQEAIVPFEGALEVLPVLRKAGYKTGLLTNGNHEKQFWKIQKFGLESLCDVIQIEEDAGAGKPEPESFAMILRKLDVHPDEAWMVGDNLSWDIDGAQNAGIFAVWNNFRGKADCGPHRPDMIIRHVRELIPVLAPR